MDVTFDGLSPQHQENINLLSTTMRKSVQTKQNDWKCQETHYGRR